MPLYYPLPRQSNLGKMRKVVSLPLPKGRILSQFYLSLKGQGDRIGPLGYIR